MLADRLFYKGMLITKLIWANVPMVIINTHILANFAGDWERRGMYARVEEKQLLQLAKTVQLQSPESLVIVAGDFNIPRRDKLYYSFLADSGLTDPLAADTRPTLRTPAGLPARFSQSIDYALIRMPNQVKFKVDCDFCFSKKYPLSKWKSGYLSDHHGIEIHITVN
jgi:endonuclease/exonuclease/phosphatase family metal-dependent hydrolase